MSAPAVPQANPPKWLTPRMRELIEITMAWPSQMAVREALRELTKILPYEDGEPMESPIHYFNIGLLVDQLYCYWPRDDYYSAGNMFVYFSPERLLREDFRGPDFFIVTGVRRNVRRTRWIAWEEGGRLPDLIIEFNSPSTAHIDLTVKKDIYEQIFRTPEYYCFDSEERRMTGWHLKHLVYEEQPCNEKGWVWSDLLQAWVGWWDGIYMGHEGAWVRFYDTNGNLLPISREVAEQLAVDAQRRADEAVRHAEEAARLAEEVTRRADAEKLRADETAQHAQAEKERADAAEAELARLRTLLAQPTRPENGAGS